jgi:DnaJ-domain-containing protein 1
VRLILLSLLIICVVLAIRYLYIKLSMDEDSSGRNQSRRFPGSGGIDKYYAVLGCTRNDSDEQIKRQYRKLAKQYHPDTIQSKGLAEDFVKFANQRIQDIQHAYETVMEHRRMHRQ